MSQSSETGAAAEQEKVDAGCGGAVWVNPQAELSSFTFRGLWSFIESPSDYIWAAAQRCILSVIEKPSPTVQGSTEPGPPTMNPCHLFTRDHTVVAFFHKAANPTHESRQYSTSCSRHHFFLDVSSSPIPFYFLLTAMSGVPGDLWLCYLSVPRNWAGPPWRQQLLPTNSLSSHI